VLQPELRSSLAACGEVAVTTAEILASVFGLITGVSGRLALIIVSGRGLRRSEVVGMVDELERAARQLALVAGE
jgi:hypothetical protein